MSINMSTNSLTLTSEETASFSHDRLSVYNLNDDASAELISADKSISERAVRYRDAIQVALPTGEYWLFDYGVIVFWAVDEDERQALINRLLRQENSQLQNIEEHFRFAFSADIKISKDTINVPDKNPLTRLAISHALAQSIKLMEYELKAQNTITDYSHFTVYFCC